MPSTQVEALASLDHHEQLEALRQRRFTLTDWCAFARRHPNKVAMLGEEFAFIAITTDEWS